MSHPSRTALLDAALSLLLDEGYPAVTSRRLAARAGLKNQLVHYHFQDMDELWLEVIARGAEQVAERQREALRSDRPLRATWELLLDPRGAKSNLELTSLANQRPRIRAAIRQAAEDLRRIQVDGLRPLFSDDDAVTVEAAIFLMNSASQVMALEAGLGLTRGHSDTLAAVEAFIAAREPSEVTSGRPPSKAPRRAGSASKAAAVASPTSKPGRRA